MSLKSLKNQTLRNKSTLNSVNLTGGASTGPVITSIVVTDSNYNNLDDTALLPAGGYAKLIGSGFASGCSAYFNGSSVTTTFVSATEVRVVIPATSVGTYNVMLFNPSTAGAIYLNLGISSAPTFTTTAGSLGTSYETTAVSTSIAATGDTPITYALYSGSLPTGVTLASNGTLSGTSPVEASSTTYSFVVQATDAQLQDTTRSFSLTISTDVVTWSTPAADFVNVLEGNLAMSNISLLATSAAGYGVTYAANTLPTGVSLSGNTIFGTPTVEQTVYTALTATANTTGRTATRFVSWSVFLGDPFFEYVSMLLPGTGTNGAHNNTFVDSSTNNFAVTRVGNTTQGTFSPYGANWSNYFDGTGDYLTIPYSTAAFDWWTSDSTIEAWVFASSWTGWSAATTQPALVGNYAEAGTTNYWCFGPHSDGTVKFTYWNGTIVTYLTSSATVVVNQWNHIAFTKTTSGITLWVNGVGNTITAVSGTPQSATAQTLTIGKTTTTAGITGYVSNLRLLKGTALYTAAFTPPTAPLTAIANTSLLTCQSNRLIDTSTNNFAITRNGDVSIQRFSPFNPSAAYSLSTIGGSGYFDGTGDYLSAPNNAAFNLGTTFTIEFWFYRTLNQAMRIVSRQDGFPPYNGFNISYGEVAGQWYFDASSSVITFADGGLANQWVHWAWVVNGTSGKVYRNGVQIGSTATQTAQTPSSITTLTIGAKDGPTNYVGGYISNLRIVKGTAVYTAAFTPPTAPVTAITNTSLLLNFTNAGIIDNAMMNDLETVGNAQISTAQSKFGSGAMFFAGGTDYLTVPSNVNLELGSGNFTIEAWIYLNARVADSAIISKGTNGAYLIYFGAGGELAFYASTNGSSWTTANLTISTLPSLSTWHHIAIVRSGDLASTYFNGTFVQNAAMTGSLISQPSVPLLVGRFANSMNGYIDDLRITKGYARYTANFTPPTAALPTS